MALTNAQYDAIMRTYNEHELENRHIHEARLKEIKDSISEYNDLDNELANYSMSLTRRNLNGEENTHLLMKAKAEEIYNKKRDLLVRNGYPDNYLDPIYTCSDCKDTGYIGHTQCHCLKKAIMKVLYRQSNIEDILSRENFDTLTLDYYLDSELESMRSIISNCKNYADNFDSNSDSILFFGDAGTGKTFLTNCIARQLLDTNHSVIYFTSFQLFDTLSQYVFRNGEVSDSVKSVHEDIFNCDLLIIDDLGTETTNSFVISQLFLIINERALRKRSTIISTNLSMEEINDRYSERIFSRLFGGYILIHPKIQDLRIKIKKISNRK